MINDNITTSIIAAISGVIGAYLVYRAQVKLSERKAPKEKSQQQISVDVMVASYEQAIKQKNITIAELIADRDYWKKRALQDESGV